MIKKIIRKLYSMHISKKFNHPYGLSDEYISDYKNHKLPYVKIFNIHRKGFTVLDWMICGLDKYNYLKYLSSASYCSMHPLNGDYSKWIDDKLTLKYLCSGTELDKYLPKYYVQIDGDGNFLPLVDFKLNYNVLDIEDLIELIKENKELAFKRASGQCGEGFYKIEYNNDCFFINGNNIGIEELKKMILNLRNYIVLEFLHPHPSIAKISSKTTNTIRVLIGRLDKKIITINSYIRFGTQKSNFVDNYAAGGVLCYLDDNGYSTEGNIFKEESYLNQVITHHPDSNEPLKFTVPMWKEIKNALQEFSHYFPQLSYMGFDFVVSNNNTVKILEINSLTSLDALQLKGPICGESKLFFDQFTK